MATNPMQRRSRNSFLLGMLTMLLIASIIIGLLFWQLITIKQKEKESKENSVMIYVLNENVSSGQTITPDMLTSKVLDKTLIPSNAFGNIDALTDYSLEDADGNSVITENNALYIVGRNGSKTKLEKDADGSYYKTVDGKKVTVRLTNIPLVAKVTMKKNTVITKDLITKSDEKVTADVRKQEYNMITLPSQLQDNDVIDIRLRMPSGLDFIVVSKKRVTLPEIDGLPSEDTILVNLSEDEILTMSNAIVEAYVMKGAELYAAPYVEPGMQQMATPTYAVSNEVMNLINNNPNIVNDARTALWKRYNDYKGADQRNNYINGELGKYTSEEKRQNIETSIEKQITQQKETRKRYLESLTGTMD